MADRDYAAEIRDIAERSAQVETEQLREWADEIERLRDEVGDLMRAIEEQHYCVRPSDHTDIERLTAACSHAWSILDDAYTGEPSESWMVDALETLRKATMQEDQR